MENHQQLVKTARTAGIWYLMLAITGILGFMVFHSQVYTKDPEETLTNLADKEMLSRLRSGNSG